MIKQPRVCHIGLHGKDVHAYSRVYHALGIRKHKPTDNFGTRMLHNTIEFQGRHHLQRDGVIGPHTFDAMRPHFDGFDRWLLEHTQVKPPPTARTIIAGACLTMLRHSPFQYQQVRPYPPDLATLWVRGSDCSGTSTLAYKIAHLAMGSVVQDPNGFGFDGYGYTGTLMNHGSRTTSPHMGDLAFYYSDYHHVGVYLGDGRVFSHGKPGDPHVIGASYATMFRTYL